MNPFTSKAFTVRWVLIHCWPGLAWFALALIWPRTWLYVMAALTSTVGLCFLVRNSRKLPLLLAASVFFSPCARAQSEPKNLGGACAIVVVVVVAGYCYFKVVKACKNLKPRVLPDDEDSTNAPPKSLSITNVALSQEFPPSYCCGGEAKSLVGGSVELEVNGNGLSIRPSRAAENVPSEDFYTTLRRFGLDPNRAGTQGAVGLISFGENGVVVAGENAREVRLQMSDDLSSWRDFAVVTAPANLKLRFTDATAEGAARFYRIKTSD